MPLHSAPQKKLTIFDLAKLPNMHLSFRLLIRLAFYMSVVWMSLLSCQKTRNGHPVKPNRNPWAEIVEMQATLAHPDAKDKVGHIVFESDTISLGKVPARSYVTRDVGFRIEGKGPVVLLNCASSCGCTAPRCPKKIYHPGDKGSFTIKFRSTDQPPGPFVKEVHLKIYGIPAKKTIIVTGSVADEKE